MAQLDSASDSDSDGWRFESVWVRHLRSLPSRQRPFFYFQTDSYLSLTRLMPCIAIAITLTSFPTSPPGCTKLPRLNTKIQPDIFCIFHSFRCKYARSHSTVILPRRRMPEQQRKRFRQEHPLVHPRRN